MHSQVVETEKERRESEIEHRRIMEECTRVMEEYKNTEKRLRSHIVKSRLFYSTRTCLLASTDYGLDMLNACVPMQMKEIFILCVCSRI